MNEHPIESLMMTAMSSIQDMVDVNTIIGEPIESQNGITIIPISKLTVGFLGGGVDYGTKKLTQTQNFGGGSGTGISITPVAILTVNGETVNLISLNEQKGNTDRFSSIIEKAPELIKLIKNNMS